MATLTAFVALLLGALATERRAAAQDAAGAFRFIPAEAIAAVVAYPKAMFDQPEMELYPKEIISAAGLKELGIDPLQIEQIVAFAEAPEGPTPPQFGIVIRMAKPYDRLNVMAPLMAMTTDGTLGGKPFRKAPQPFLPSLMLPNDRTIVIAPEPTLAKMMSGKAADSELLKLLRKLPAGQHVSVVATLDPIRDMINAGIAQAPPLPPPFQQFTKIPDHVKSLEVHAALGASLQAKIVMHSPTTASAGELERLLSMAVEFGKQAFLAQTAQMATSSDPVEQAAARYAERLSNHIGGAIAPKLEGDTVSLTLKAEANTATMGVAVALLLPAVQASREAARRTSAMNNLRQIVIAFHNYHDSHRQFPSRGEAKAGAKSQLSWRVHVLPYLEQAPLYEQFHLDEPWDSDHNKTLIAKMPAIYRVPGQAADATKTNYQVLVGKGTIYEKPEGVGIRDILDGTSNTILVVETNNEQAVIWTKPEDLEVDPEKPFAGLLGLRPGGFQAAFADGAVRFISQNLDLATLRALFTKAGGEAVRNF